MREYKAELAGQKLTLGATFKASMDIAEQIGDPLMIAREAALESMMMSQGINYQPRWMFNVRNVPELIHIGVKAAGGKKSLEAIQELVFEAGFVAARDVATEYLALIVGPQPEEKLDEVDEEKDDSAGE